MSKISLAPDASGTGIFTIASPNSNTNRTLTLPDDTGTIVTNSGNQAGSFTTLNTSGAVVFNDAGADVDFRVEGDTNANLLFVDASREAVGVGVAPSAWGLGLGLVGLDIGAAGHVLGTGATVNSGANCYYDGSAWKYKTSTYANYYEQNSNNTGVHAWFIAPSGTAGNTATFTQAMTLDANGALLVGQTTLASNTVGASIQQSGVGIFTRDSDISLLLNRKTSDGDILEFRKDGTKVGSIGSVSGLVSYIVLDPRASGAGMRGGSTSILPANEAGAAVNNSIDLGTSATRWKDIYLVNSPNVSSDRNLKQDIEKLSEAEQRVAVACKALLRKWRFKDAVAKKGDDARIHFGIIAQDLKAAFEAEGLDAHRYGMFMWNEWWEHEVEVPAVEAQEAVYETQTDEEGNEVQVLVSEAVEGKEAYTRTDTYETEAEAPEGAVRKERMGIRYNELLAFIIAAI